jgi:hypothetical protein
LYAHTYLMTQLPEPAALVFRVRQDCVKWPRPIRIFSTRPAIGFPVTYEVNVAESVTFWVCLMDIGPV